MMEEKAQLKVQAWLDGELPEAEARAMANRVAQDPEAAALTEELGNTQKALAGFEADIRLPESREFFWSKVAREIERVEAAPPEPAPRESWQSYFALFRRFLVPASAVALAAVVGLVITRPTVPPGQTAGADVETALADAGAFTYRDYTAGTTLVWLSYPADNEVAQADEMDTVE